MEYFCEQAIFCNVFRPVKQNQVGFNRNANKEISFIYFYWSFMIFVSFYPTDWSVINNDL